MRTLERVNRIALAVLKTDTLFCIPAVVQPMEVIRAELLNYVIDSALWSQALFAGGQIIESASG